MRSIICSDCHGKPWLITNVLHHSDYEKGTDRLIFCGDFCDLGPNPRRCLEILIEEGAEILLGNHDLAIAIGQRIHPAWQTDYENDALLDILLDFYYGHNFKVSAIIEPNVIISHAGISQSFYDYDSMIDDKRKVDLGAYNSHLNSIPHRDLIELDGPLWYRPNHQNPPIDEWFQIVGHTPPEAMLVYDKFISLDPWTSEDWEMQDLTRYRYALVENDCIKLIDSNLGSMKYDL